MYVHFMLGLLHHPLTSNDLFTSIYRDTFFNDIRIWVIELKKDITILPISIHRGFIKQKLSTILVYKLLFCKHKRITR